MSRTPLVDLDDPRRLIAEVDRVADMVQPMLVHCLYVQDMAGLNLSLLNAYLVALREVRRWRPI